jgi:hypothetical protein
MGRWFIKVVKLTWCIREYREILELIQSKIEGMPSNISAVPGAIKKLLNE